MTFFDLGSIIEPLVRKMGKYLYISTVKWSSELAKKNTEDPNYILNKWMPAHDAIAKEHGLEVKYTGTPFGCPDDACLVYESDTGVDGYRDFRFAIARMPNNIISSANTTIVAL